ncbi:MAG TPA: L-seryl-tRNA(Sec) selenium transferase [Burkholderiales bacterium]
MASVPLASLPSVDRLLRSAAAAPLLSVHGRSAVTLAVREVLGELRAAREAGLSETALLERIATRLDQEARPTLRPVFNLTGTVLHTNLGRALLPEAAIEAMVAVARAASNLEYDLADGRRGERDHHVEKLLCALTGAEAASVVNNNAAAVLLVLNTLAQRKEVPTSRGELIEIGGSFRLPDIMARSGCRLREVGTTNRTHLADYAEAIGPKTGAVLKIHASNYSIEGFTAAVPEAELAQLCRSRGLPFIVDLGSGALVDLRRYGLPHEPTPAETLAQGADVVTFSGDKLLGGPQAGIIVGRSELVERMRKNPLKRALRVDKMTLAALAALLRIYTDPDRVAERIPTLRLLARPLAAIRTQAARVQPLLQAALKQTVEVIDCQSQVGSGAAPTQRIASAGLAIRPGSDRLAAAFRALPIPVIGRVQDGAFILDLRCLEDEAAFVAQLGTL